MQESQYSLEPDKTSSRTTSKVRRGLFSLFYRQCSGDWLQGYKLPGGSERVLGFDGSFGFFLNCFHVT